MFEQTAKEQMCKQTDRRILQIERDQQTLSDVAFSKEKQWQIQRGEIARQAAIIEFTQAVLESIDVSDPIRDGAQI
jgi:hypothetical protein